MRARVRTDTDPFPFKTLLVVWKLTPERAATSLTDTCLDGLDEPTGAAIMGPLSERSPRPEYPRPNLRRSEWLNLNGEWEFGSGEKPAFERRIVVPFCPQSELSGVSALPGDVVWYRRRFEAPECERLVLRFGAVDYRA